MRPLGRRRSGKSGLPGVRLLAIAAFLLLPACASTDSVTSSGREIGTFYNFVFFIALVVFVGVNGALLYFVAKYRRKPTDVDMPPQVHGSTVAEITWTVIPALVVFGLFAMSWTTMQSVGNEKDEPGMVVVNVQGYQWNWQFNYGGDFTVKAPPIKDGKQQFPELQVPINEPVRFVLTSDNVIHSFYVPDTLFKMDVVPGRANEFETRFDASAVYKGQCAEFCGTQHSAMNFTLKAVPRKDFDAWVKDSKAKACAGEPSETLEIAAPQGQIAFDKDCLVAPAGKPVNITFNNGGPELHNVVLAESQANPAPIAQTGKPIPAGQQTAVFPAQPAGKKFFYCLVHPVMNGTYTVQ